MLYIYDTKELATKVMKVIRRTYGGKWEVVPVECASGATRWTFVRKDKFHYFQGLVNSFQNNA